MGLPLAAGALLPSANIMLTPSIAGALMGISSLGVMTNSLLLQLEFSRPSSDIPVKPSKQQFSKENDVELGLGSQQQQQQQPSGKFSH